MATARVRLDAARGCLHLQAPAHGGLLRRMFRRPHLALGRAPPQAVESHHDTPGTTRALEPMHLWRWPPAWGDARRRRGA
eukprot:7703529-Heterocapsa_arctica.AAC.1